MPARGVTGQLSTIRERFTSLRTGTITTVNPFFCLVMVGETEVRAGYLRSLPPLIGDVVAVFRQGAGWFVAGTVSSSGDNLITNSSFEELDSVGQPVGWTLHNVAGTSRVDVAPADFTVDGSLMARVMPTTGGAATALFYSPPFSVTAGDEIEVSAYSGGYYPTDAAQTVDVSLVALWFANATNLYPTTSSADITVVSRTDIAEAPPMVNSGGTVTAPVTGYMRLGLRSVMADETGVWWDFATARLTGA